MIAFDSKEIMRHMPLVIGNRNQSNQAKETVESFLEGLKRSEYLTQRFSSEDHVRSTYRNFSILPIDGNFLACA